MNLVGMFKAQNNTYLHHRNPIKHRILNIHSKSHLITLVLSSFSVDRDFSIGDLGSRPTLNYEWAFKKWYFSLDTAPTTK